MSIPGYYKIDYHALSLSGIAQMRGALRSPPAYVATRFMQATPIGWMPTLWADLECTKKELSDRFWETTGRHRRDFEMLGFIELGPKKVKKTLNPLHRDNGGVNYVDTTRCHFAQLIYSRTHVAAPVRADKEQVTVAFTSVFEQSLLSYTNSMSPFDSLPHHEVVRRRSDEVGPMYKEFVEHLKCLPEMPRRFPDDDSLRRWFDSNQTEVFEERVRSGVFVRMTDAEVEAARRKLPPPLPKRTDAC